MITDFQLLRQGLTALLQSHSTSITLVGDSDHLSTETQPWGDDVPEVVLLDLGTDSQQTLPCLRQWRAQNGPKVLLLCRNEPAELIDQAVLAGARGVIPHDCPSKLLLIAIEKVQQGQIWLDHDTTARLISSLASRPGAPNPPPDPDPTARLTLAKLTPREQAIISSMLQNGNEAASQIAKRLCISESTLRNHLTAIYEKLGVKSRSGLVTFALQSGLTELLRS